MSPIRSRIEEIPTLAEIYQDARELSIRSRMHLLSISQLRSVNAIYLQTKAEQAYLLSLWDGQLIPANPWLSDWPKKPLLDKPSYTLKAAPAKPVVAQLTHSASPSASSPFSECRP